MRCHIPPDAWNPSRLVADDDEAHHLIHVLRVRPGQPVEAFDGAGRTAEAEIDVIQKHRVELRVLQQREHPRPAVELTLIQAVPREQKMDLVIQKATELGVSRLVPVLTRHSLVRLRGDAGEAKQARWDRIVINAAKQCGAVWLPDVAPPQPMTDFLAARPPLDLLIVCSLEPDAQPLKDVLRAKRSAPPHRIAALVGPEGDFSQEERAAIRTAGAIPVTFGDLTLRTETAALYALAALKYEFC